MQIRRATVFFYSTFSSRRLKYVECSNVTETVRKLTTYGAMVTDDTGEVIDGTVPSCLRSYINNQQ